MLEQLAKTFENDFTTMYDATDDQYIWFQTTDHEIFGLSKTICETKLSLIRQLFECVHDTHPVNHVSTHQQKWYAFLFEGSNILPLEKDTISVRFYYINYQKPLEEISIIEEAFYGIFSQATFLTISPTESILIEENIQRDSQDLFDQCVQSLMSDLLIPFRSYIGQMHICNIHLARQFIVERQFFKQYEKRAKGNMVIKFHEAFNHICMMTSLCADVFSTQLREQLQLEENRAMIETFCNSHLNISLAAKQLFIHRNSLQYRIERFLQLTGIDIRNFSEAMFLSLAIQLVDNMHN